jgi:hypothetical protein
MMARRSVIGVLSSGAIAGLIGGCRPFATSPYRFSMTVFVDTPTGLKQGSSVYEVRVAKVLRFLPDEANRDWIVIGESVAIDLAPGRTLFTLLSTVNPMGRDLAYMSMTTLDPRFKNDLVESAKRISLGTGTATAADVPVNNLPAMVTFGDIADPKSVLSVDPMRLDTTFGEGFTLQRVNLRTTEDPVSSQVGSKLRWLDGNPEQRLDNKFSPTSNPSLAQILRQGDFRQGAN